MTRAHLRVVLAAVVACTPALVGASIASASAEPASSKPVAVQNVAHHQVAAKHLSDDSATDHSTSTIIKSHSGSKSATSTRQVPAPVVRADGGKSTTTRHSTNSDAKPGSGKHASRADDRKRDQRRHKTTSRSSHRTCHPPHHVAGLSEGQTWNARMIVRAGNKLHVGHKGKVVAMATSLQETHLRNYANVNVPMSLHIQHEAIGRDHDSVGLFQQRPVAPWGAGSWGTPKELMNPETSATKFYLALKHIHNWWRLPVTVAAQRVQVSAFPGAYADDAQLARQIVDNLKCP